ncbi:glycosyltransferase [Aureimonas leprariae]|nr:glycosyltransferase family 2 protein [Aureimonas leprariae]
MTNCARVPVVAVPARDEEERLPPLLAALGGQTWLDAGGARLRVVLVLNNCTDDSAGAAIRAAAAQPRLALDVVEVSLPPDAAHVGTARRMAMERVLEGCDPTSVALLTTDADAVPAPDWIEANLYAIAAGADLVGGLIVGDPAEEARLGPGFRRRAEAFLDYAALADRLAALIDPLPHDPWPRHRDHTGASLAVRGEVYAAVGGMPPLPFREDLAFASRVRLAGGRLRHDSLVRVEVSARLAGRAPGGMADCLKEWLRAEAENRPILVEAPDAIEARLVLRRALRDLDGAGVAERRRAAERFGLDPRGFSDATGAPLPGFALAELFAPDAPDAPATVPVEAASAALRAAIARLEGERHAA